MLKERKAFLKEKKSNIEHGEEIQEKADTSHLFTFSYFFFPAGVKKKRLIISEFSLGGTRVHLIMAHSVAASGRSSPARY